MYVVDLTQATPPREHYSKLVWLGPVAFATIVQRRTFKVFFSNFGLDVFLLLILILVLLFEAAMYCCIFRAFNGERRKTYIPFGPLRFPYLFVCFYDEVVGEKFLY